MAAKSVPVPKTKLEETIAILTELRTVCTSLITESVDYMKRLKDESSTLVKRFIDKNSTKKEGPITTPAVALEILRKVTLRWLGDSEEIIKEVDGFILSGPGPELDVLVIDEKHYVNEACEFLIQVWCGDVYDESGTNALKRLLEDNRKNLKKINIPFLFLEGKNLLMAKPATKKAVTKVPKPEKAPSPEPESVEEASVESSPEEEKSEGKEDVEE
jgi:hypothetical protein